MTTRTQIRPDRLHLGEGSLFEPWDHERLEKELLFPYLVVLTFDDERRFTLDQIVTLICAARASNAQAETMVERHGSVNPERFC